MSNGSANQRYIDAISGQSGGGGLYGAGPVQSYTRPLTPKKRLELQALYSNPTQGKAFIDPYGRVLGYEKEGTLVEQRASERLLAKLMGATATQLAGPRAPGMRPDLSFLKPEQFEQLMQFRERFGAGSSSGGAMSSALAAPGASGIPSVADATGFGVPRTLKPNVLLLAGAALFGILLLARR